MTYERVVEGGVEVLDVDLGLDPDSGDDACLFWPPRRPEALLPLLLGDHVSLSRGEEVGKSSLEKVGAAEVLGRAEILAGEGVGARYVQPRATHLIEPSRLVKSASRYSAPKVVVVKTGGRVKAAIDREGHATLQSVYNIHLKRGAPPWMTLEFVCGLLNCEEVHRRFIAPFTSGKMLFPQITQRMLREIRLPEVSAAQAGEVSEAVRAAENAEVGAAERVQELFGPLFPGSAG